MLDTVPRPTGSTDEATAGALTVRVAKDLIDEMKLAARHKERSLNYVAARVLRRGLEELRREGWLDAKD